MIIFAPAPSPRPTTLWITLKHSDKLLYSSILKTLRSAHSFPITNHSMNNTCVNRSCLPWLINPLSLFYFYIIMEIMHIWQCVVVHYKCDAYLYADTIKSPQWRWWYWKCFFSWSWRASIDDIASDYDKDTDEDILGNIDDNEQTCESSAGQEWWRFQVPAGQCLGKPLQGPQSQLPGDYQVFKFWRTKNGICSFH